MDQTPVTEVDMDWTKSFLGNSQEEANGMDFEIDGAMSVSDLVADIMSPECSEVNKYKLNVTNESHKDINLCEDQIVILNDERFKNGKIYHNDTHKEENLTYEFTKDGGKCTTETILENSINGSDDDKHTQVSFNEKFTTNNEQMNIKTIKETQYNKNITETPFEIRTNQVVTEKNTTINVHERSTLEILTENCSCETPNNDFTVTKTINESCRVKRTKYKFSSNCFKSITDIPDILDATMICDTDTEIFSPQFSTSSNTFQLDPEMHKVFLMQQQHPVKCQNELQSICDVISPRNENNYSYNTSLSRNDNNNVMCSLLSSNGMTEMLYDDTVYQDKMPNKMIADQISSDFSVVHKPIPLFNDGKFGPG